MARAEFFQVKKDLIDKEYELKTQPTIMKGEFANEVNTKYKDKLSDAQDTMLGGYTEGLGRYKDVSNPFLRKKLSTKYATGLSKTYDFLTKEKEKETEAYNAYVDKYAGLFSADIAREKSMNTLFEQQANEIESLEKEQAKVDEEKDKVLFYDYVKSGLSETAGMDAKVDAKKYESLREEAFREMGMSKSQFDSEFGYLLSEEGKYGVGARATDPTKKEKEEKPLTEKQKYTSVVENATYGEKNKEIQKYTDVMNSGKTKDDVKSGELYFEDGVVKKKDPWWRLGKDSVVFDPNE